MSKKNLFDYIEVIESVNVIDLENEEVRKILGEDSYNVYDLLSSVYHSKLDAINTVSDLSFSDSTKLNKYVENEEILVCIYCSQSHDTKDCTQVFCKKCGMQGHTTKRCASAFNVKKSVRCTNCDYSTHTEFDCPAKYRIYELNKEIDMDKLIKSCAYCAGSHFSDDCVTSLESNKFSVFSDRFINHLIKKKKN